MTLSVTLPDELQSGIEKIPDWQDRLESFARNQIALEELRQSRYTSEERARAADILKRAQQMKESGVSREQVASRIRKHLDQFSGE